MRNGRLIILSGPAGAGKGTLRERLFRIMDSLQYSVSCTTRKPRPQEREGRDYFFISEDCFKKMIDRGEFLEWASVHQNLYGTPKKQVLELINRGQNVIVEVDVKGAMQIRENMPEAVTIFICPPDIQALKYRLKSRGTEDERTIALRVKNAQEEMSALGQYQYVIVNDDVERASKELIALVSKLLI